MPETANGLFSDGGPIARYQNVETHPSARRQGLAGTLVYRAGRYGLDTLGARALVMVADPGVLRDPDIPFGRVHGPGDPGRAAPRIALVLGTKGGKLLPCLAGRGIVMRAAVLGAG